jgi:hypothetical protein
MATMRAEAEGAYSPPAATNGLFSRSDGRAALCAFGTSPVASAKAASQRCMIPMTPSRKQRAFQKSRNCGRQVQHVCDHHDLLAKQHCDSIKVRTLHGGNLRQQNIARHRGTYGSQYAEQRVPVGS